MRTGVVACVLLVMDYGEVGELGARRLRMAPGWLAKLPSFTAIELAGGTGWRPARGRRGSHRSPLRFSSLYIGMMTQKGRSWRA